MFVAWNSKLGMALHVHRDFEGLFRKGDTRILGQRCFVHGHLIPPPAVGGQHFRTGRVGDSQSLFARVCKLKDENLSYLETVAVPGGSATGADHRRLSCAVQLSCCGNRT
jgi:hypothetical protein